MVCHTIWYTVLHTISYAREDTIGERGRAREGVREMPRGKGREEMGEGERRREEGGEEGARDG